MTKIYNISAGFLQNYVTLQSKHNDMKPEEIFKRLSLEMGGDGKTITKKQLDSYISNAESGAIDVDKSKLDALKRIQKDWDTISKGKDSISYDDMKDYPILLIATMTGDFTETDVDKPSSGKDSVFDYLLKRFGLSSKDEITEAHLNSYLKELVAQSSENDSNSESIGVVTNLIADFSSNSTVEKEA